MKNEKEDTLETLIEDFEDLFRKIDHLLLNYERRKTEKLEEARKLLESHDPLMNAEQPPMVLFTSLLSAMRRVHNVDQLHRLRYELTRVHESTVLRLDCFPHRWELGTM